MLIPLQKPSRGKLRRQSKKETGSENGGESYYELLPRLLGFSYQETFSHHEVIDTRSGLNDEEVAGGTGQRHSIDASEPHGDESDGDLEVLWIVSIENIAVKRYIVRCND